MLMEVSGWKLAKVPDLPIKRSTLVTTCGLLGLVVLDTQINNTADTGSLWYQKCLPGSLTQWFCMLCTS